VEKLPTPYFVIDEEVLKKYYKMLKDSLCQNWSNYLIGYSFKTNSLPWLISFVKGNGAYAEVVSEDEYLLARYLGYKNNEIIYNGPYKSKTSFREVLLAGGYVNLDSLLEISWLSQIACENPGQNFFVGIRVNFDLEKKCPGETTMGKVGSRFGFCYETGKFAEAVAMLKKFSNVSIAGLHLHCSSKSRSVKIFRSIAQMACQIQCEFQLSLSYIDLGGGYCGGLEGRPEYPNYFPIIAEELSKNFEPSNTKLIVEPGISLVSKCTAFVTSIFDTKDIKGTRYVMTDGSRFNIDATMIKNSYLFHVINNKQATNERPVMRQQIISGYTCMECDRLFIYENQQELVPGDEIVYENVGGYTMSLNPLFIQYFPPVYVRRNNRLILVRRKWTPKDYVQGNIVIEETK